MTEFLLLALWGPGTPLIVLGVVIMINELVP